MQHFFFCFGYRIAHFCRDARDQIGWHYVCVDILYGFARRVQLFRRILWFYIHDTCCEHNCNSTHYFAAAAEQVRSEKWIQINC